MREAVAGRRRLIAAVVAVAVVLAAAAWGATYTSLFSARHVRVHGVRVLTPEDVRALAQISPATNVAHLDAAAVRSRLVTSPWIADADVETDLPGTVVVTVRERQPVGVIDAMGKRSILASDGTELPVDGVSTLGLPLVRAALGAPDDGQRAAAAALLSALDPVVFARVASVLVAQDSSLSLTLRSGAEVRAGLPGAEVEKADTLRGIVRWATERHVGLTSIDISTPTAPSVRLADGSTVSP
jgi:cell division protein FtsQ